MYLLYHVAAGLAGGGAFQALIWHQYLRQSRDAAAFGVSQAMPTWAAPVAESPAILGRALWHPDWWTAIGLILLGQILVRLNFFGLGYALFRVVSDVERLPFPLATIAAEGATALAESPERKESWRWQWFSFGSMLGLGFGLVYIGVPALTGLVFASPLAILPIPWVDFTAEASNVLPAAPLNFSFDLGAVLWGMVIPFWAVVGGFVAMVATSLIGNPILQSLGYLPTWGKGMGVLATVFSTQFDLWLSVGAGVSIAVALVGIWQLIKVLRSQGGGGRRRVTDVDILMGKEGGLLVGAGRVRGSWTPPAGRGDFPLWVAVMMFVVSTSGYVALCHWLVPRFPLWLLMFFGFVWTPLISYISARMIGLTGNGVGIPYVKEASFILSGYKGVDIWFAPIPLNDMGPMTTLFKQLELTKTKFTSLWKAELLMLPISVGFSFLFWAFLWHLTSIPSHAFPFVDKIWPFNAKMAGLWMTATTEGRAWLLDALKPSLVGVGLVSGLALYNVVVWMKWPVFLFYGAAGGVGAMPNVGILMLIGALLGRYYFAPKFGAERWFRYAPVLGAGFAAGAGLIGMLAVGITMVHGSTVTKPF
jgi:hypothetical protein